MSNKSNTLYIGITNNLQRRVFEHKNKLVEGFTARYNINRLVYCQQFTSPEEAIAAEKKIKGWTRKKKMELIRTTNPELIDLSVAHGSETSSETLRQEPQGDCGCHSDAGRIPCECET